MLDEFCCWVGMAPHELALQHCNRHDTLAGCDPREHQERESLVEHTFSPSVIFTLRDIRTAAERLGCVWKAKYVEVVPGLSSKQAPPSTHVFEMMGGSSGTQLC